MVSNALDSTSTGIVPHWIGGPSRHETAENSGPLFDPATGESTARVAFATEGVVDQAVRVAAEAARDWRETSLARRSRILFSFRELVERHKQELATLVTREHGKVLSDALGEVQRGLEVVEFACGIGELIKGEFSENVSTEVDSYSIRQPLGVVAGITPFNFPVMVPMWMYPLAIACGNAFILKPSEKDPSASNFCARLFQEAGLPDGVFNVVHGDRVAVDAILGHPGIAAVSFVGSTPIARHVYETATRAGKRVQALGGAKNHMVVLADADLELAADAAVSAAYGSAGERCMAISVLVAVGDPRIDFSPDPRPHRARESGTGARAGGRDGPARHPRASRSGRSLRRDRRLRRSSPHRGRSRDSRRESRGRVLSGALSLRRRHSGR